MWVAGEELGLAVGEADDGDVEGLGGDAAAGADGDSGGGRGMGLEGEEGFGVVGGPAEEFVAGEEGGLADVAVVVGCVPLGGVAGFEEDDGGAVAEGEDVAGVEELGGAVAGTAVGFDHGVAAVAEAGFGEAEFEGLGEGGEEGVAVADGNSGVGGEVDTEVPGEAEPAGEEVEPAGREVVHVDGEVGTPLGDEAVNGLGFRGAEVEVVAVEVDALVVEAGAEGEAVGVGGGNDGHLQEVAEEFGGVVE